MLRLLTALLCLGSLTVELAFDASTPFVRDGAVAQASAPDAGPQEAPAHAAVLALPSVLASFTPVTVFSADREPSYLNPPRTPSHRPPIVRIQS